MRRTPLFTTFLLACLLTACTAVSTGGTDPEIARLIDEGKAALARNEWSNAKAAFEQVLADYDAENGEAHLGAALADILYVSDAIPYIASVGERTASTLAPAAESDDESLYLTGLIVGAVNEVRAHFSSAEAHLSAADEAGGFTFVIDSLPVRLTQDGAFALDLGGEWDRADALMLRGLSRLALGALDMVLSVDLNFDFPRAHAYLMQPAFDAQRLDHVASLVTYLLNDPKRPNFLGLAEGGDERLTQAAHTLGDALRDLEAALAAASQERDDQHDDVLRYVDANANGRYDPALTAGRDACALVSSAAPEAAGAEPIALFDARFETSSTYPYLIHQVVCLMQKAQANLDWDHRDGFAPEIAAAYAERPRINVLGDALPAVDAAVAGISAAEPAVTFGVPVPNGLLTTLVKEVLGDSIELDPYAFFVPGDAGLPGTVRAMLPAWESYPCPATGVCLNEFVVEMECSPLPATQATFPAPFEDAFPAFELKLPICKQAWIDGGQTADTPHFTGAIAADGFVGYLPYVQFQDASLHGVLYLNLVPTADIYAGSKSGQNAAIAAGLEALDGNAGDFKPAGLAELNTFVAALASNAEVGGALLELVEKGL